MSEQPRMLVWFSCGAPSACAAEEALCLYRKQFEVLIVNCDTRPSEHSDNYRFSKEVEQWLQWPIIYIRSEDYADVDDVFVKTRYMAGVAGARCTTELKKIPRQQFSCPNDTHVFGYTAEEKKRAHKFQTRNPELCLKWILIEQGITRSDCLQRLKQVGIQGPEMYRLGFDNNNCPGCVKASSPWYWDMVRKHFPTVFALRAKRSRELGVRLVEIRHHVRIFLDELPPGPFKKRRKKEILSCGPECGSPGIAA